MRILLVALLISTPVFAEICSEIHLRGSVRVNKAEMFVVMAEKTQSQKKLPVYLKTQSRLSPYIGHYVQLKAIVDQDKIISILDVKDDVPEMINRNAETEMKKVKEVPCPSL